MNPRENWEKVFYFSGKVNIRAARAQLNAKYREERERTMGSRLPNPTESGHM